METENLWFDFEGERGEEIEKKKRKIWNHEFALAWNLESFWFKTIRSKYYYLTKWTEKSTVYGNWQLVVWPWRWEKLKKKNKNLKSRIRTGMKSGELLV